MTHHVLNLKETHFQLPSEGLPYSGVLNLISGDSVQIRPLTAGDQKVIAVRGVDPYRVYFNLLSRVVVAPTNIDLDKLLVSDANAILFATRLMSLGPNYGFNHQCENCGNKHHVDVDLSQTEVKYASEMEDFSATDLEFEMPDGSKLTFHLPTLGDEKSVANYIVNRKRKGNDLGSQLDPTYLRLAQLIDLAPELGEVKSKMLSSKVDYIDSLPLSILNDFVDAVYKRDIGVTGLIYSTCQNCGWEAELNLGISEEFFRPNRR